MRCDQVFILSAVCSVLTFDIAFCAKDYYDLLGVKRSATEKEIKRAFRKQAVKYHPDKNKDPDAEKQFVEIAKAYETLSDPEKRRKYDQFGEDGEKMGGSGDSGFGGFNFNFNDFFKGFDDAFSSHKSGHHDHHHGQHFKFHFGGNGNKAQFFNFDDLFEDDDNDADFFDVDPFANAQTFNFGFDDDDSDFFGFHNHYDAAHNHQAHMHQHMKHHQRAQEQHKWAQEHHKKAQAHHQHVHMNMQNIRTSNQGGRTCRTVTQRVGNMVTTHTECS